MKPLVHHISNQVSMHLQANACYAYGASPLMTRYAPEFEAIYPKVNSLLINLGTPSQDQWTVMEEALKWAQVYQIPTCLDPVGLHLSPHREKWVLGLLSQYKISVLKGNWAEISHLLKALLHNTPQLTGRFKGLDALDRPESGQQVIKQWQAHLKIALKYVEVIVITGPEDYIIYPSSTGAPKLDVIHVSLDRQKQKQKKGQTHDQDQELEKGQGLEIEDTWGDDLQAYSGLGCLCGSLIACDLGRGYSPLEACRQSLSHLKLCLYQTLKDRQMAQDFEARLIENLRKMKG